MPATFSTFASTVQGETAFTVLAVAKRLLAAGKDVIELEIGDSPFPTSPAALLVGPGAKIFEQFFCEAFVNPGDGVLVFSPHFPTYPANIQRRGARMVVSPLRAAHDFRPDLEDVERFLAADPSPKGSF